MTQRPEFCSEAYAVACLGVTALDWERLGVAALEELSFEVARKAFQRSENILFLTLIDQLQVRLIHKALAVKLVTNIFKKQWIFKGSHLKKTKGSLALVLLL